GNIVLNSDTTLSAAVNTLTVTGAISGSGALTKVGASTLFLGAVESYTGATTVTAGTLTVGGPGTLLTTSGLTVNVNSGTSGPTFTLANQTPLSSNPAAFNILDRLNDTGPITLSGGTFNFLGNNTPGAFSTATVGQILLNSGNSLINSTSGN